MTPSKQLAAQIDGLKHSVDASHNLLLSVLVFPRWIRVSLHAKKSQ